MRAPLAAAIGTVFAALFGDARDAVCLDAGAGRAVMGAGTARIEGSDAGEALGELRRALRADAVVADGGIAPGWFGWLGYEAGAVAAGAAAASASHDAPQLLLMRCPRIVIIDEVAGWVECAWLSSDVDGEGWAEAVFHDVRGAALGAESAESGAAPAQPRLASAELAWRRTPAEYLAAVTECVAAIRRGDAYQLCLTDTATSPLHPDPVTAWRMLRAVSPTATGGLVRGGEHALVSASPESFLRVEASGRVTTSPIKGTRPRHGDAATDAALAAELAADPKERAENLMIVDLMRNDLARVAELGSVAVTRLLEVESYAQVHQLVSAVEARLAPGRDAVDAVAATFPAGSMTGAPKLAAIGILNMLEAGPRGLYAGCFGRFGFDGTAELSMTIRSLVIGPGGTTIGSGGGITALSDPARELAELRLKAEVLGRVLAAASAAG